MAYRKLVVPVDYGANRNWYISDASVATIEAAAAFLKRHAGGHVIGFGNADLPEYGMLKENSSEQKHALFDALQKKYVLRFEAPERTSREEAENIRGVLAKNGIEVERVILFCDRWHARIGGLRGIWEEAFPGVPIEVHTIRCHFGNDYACTYMRSELKWITHNLIRLALLKLGLLDRVTEWRMRRFRKRIG